METEYEATIEKLLRNWEAAYKQGLLSFWILLLLHDRPAYAYEMSELIREISHGSMSAESNSIYRALGRFDDAGILESRLEPSGSGPPRRYYQLTTLGFDLLSRFINRNILQFSKPPVIERLDAVMNYPEAATEG
jgi:DNA-binding PadR family transcriptional regulator